MSEAVRFENVACRVRNGELVHDLSFSVNEGETLVLLGRSGSGKTTTLKLVNRLLDATSGSVIVEGRAVSDWDAIELRRRIGYVIQEIGLFPHFTIRRNVSLVPSLLNWQSTRIEDRYREVMKLVDLDPVAFADRFPSELSGGQRQRIGVARALAADPPLLLMDEPFGALDPITRSDLQMQFHALQQTLKKTVVFVTHDVSEAFLLGDRIGVMEAGSLMELGSRKKMMASNHPLIDSFRNSVEGFLKHLPSLDKEGNNGQLK
jgi:osmoprotectant transport system ATP-binding protein